MLRVQGASAAARRLGASGRGPSVRRLGALSYATVVTDYNRLTGHFLLKSRPQDYGRLRNRQQL